ncbi:FN3KRP [Cordylochernes scorpioides]|uniref:protein-ribulosamine 3-kinase n=1 Tax=Cordylochernes scorpioides TaxID=51811 RepID=A0ABY6LKU2_9ARAC|nr:FN3KRP [Cordylochernes scorpioides]
MSGARMSGSAKKNWKRSQYHQLTNVEKMKIIKEIEQGKSHSQVSRERNIPRSTISTIFKNKFAIKSAFLKSNFSSTLKRDRDGEFPEIEEALFRWIRQANAMKLAINGNILKEKAILLALKKMGQDNFEASNGWLEKFKARRNIAFKRLHGEAGSVDANSVATWKGFVMDEAMEEVVEEEINRCFEALKKHQAIDVNYIDFLEVDKDVQVSGEQSIEEIVKEVMGKEEDEEKPNVKIQDCRSRRVDDGDHLSDERANSTAEPAVMIQQQSLCLMEKVLKESLGISCLKSLGDATGGCINEGKVYETDQGVIFVKKNSGQQAKTMFDGELASLNAILKTGTVHVPKPIKQQQYPLSWVCKAAALGLSQFSASLQPLLGMRICGSVTKKFVKVLELPKEGGAILAMEYLGKLRGLSDHSRQLGTSLARLHLHNMAKLGEQSSIHKDDNEPVTKFGFEITTCCGYIPLDNSWSDSWVNEIGERFSLPRTTVRDILTQAEKWENYTVGSSKRQRVEKFSDLEDALSNWFTQKRANNIIITDDLLREKAKKLGEQLAVPENFAYSSGWLQRFKGRFHILQRRLCGEGASISLAIIDEHLTNLNSIPANLDMTQPTYTMQTKQDYFFSSFLTEHLLTKMKTAVQHKDTLPSTKYDCQSLDSGIIKSFKAQYRKLQLQKMVELADAHLPTELRLDYTEAEMKLTDDNLLVSTVTAKEELGEDDDTTVTQRLPLLREARTAA